MPNHRDALVPPPPQDEARKRWTKPVVREWDSMTETDSTYQTSKHRDAEDETIYSVLLSSS